MADDRAVLDRDQRQGERARRAQGVDDRRLGAARMLGEGEGAGGQRGDRRRVAVTLVADRGGDQSTSSTSTVSPVTRCDSAAAMKRSRSPSSTSDGAVEVVPVLRSFTI